MNKKLSNIDKYLLPINNDTLISLFKSRKLAKISGFLVTISMLKIVYFLR